MRPTVRVLTLLAWLVSIPSAALAQAVIAGTVRDSSGAVLPGVGVEATSPALIEKVRSTVSDGTGQYRIEDLRPGIYSVTFTLQGFNTFRREGVELTGSFTATINAELKIGALAETITVSGESPIVDVQTAKRETTLSNEVIRSLPTVRNYNAMVVLVPGVVTNTNDVATGPLINQFPINGGRANESRLTVDGLNVGNPPGGNQPPTYVADVANSQEVTFTTSGGLGESETGGLVMNIIPKTGGNNFSGSAYFSGSGEHFLADNYDDEIRAAGLAAPTPTKKIYDLNGAIGGPIMKDRIWFFVNARTEGSTRVNANQFYNLNAGDPTKWLYAPDFSRPGFSDRTWENASGRITWQATRRNKIGVFWDEQSVCRKCEGTSTGLASPAQIVSPEADGVGATKPLRVQQVTWSSPATSRLLLDAGFGTTYYGWGNFERDDNNTRGLVRVQEQCAAGCAANGGIPNLYYRSQDWNDNRTGAYPWRASISYITGRHSLKFGHTGTYFTDDRTSYTNDQQLRYRLNNGVPNQLTEAVPFTQLARAAILGFYAQEQLTLSRLTLQGGLRYDQARGWFPEQTIGPTRFLPAPIVFPETKGVDTYRDISPRIGAALDVFGTGKTALKFSLGRYLEGASTGNPVVFYNTNPTLRLPNTNPPFGPLGVQRTWTDANFNFQPDCDLQSPNAQDLRDSRRDFCGQISNLLFGQSTLTSSFDPDLLTGMGVRSSDWGLGLSVQQQIHPRASIEIAYNRRWFSDFTAVDNRKTQSSDYTPYSITAPLDPRLPGGGGYPVSGLYDIVPTLSGQIDNLTTLANKYGQWSQNFDGVGITLSVRTRGGLTFQGGTNTGRTVVDACDVRANLPELNATVGAGLAGSLVNLTSPYCQVNYSWLTQVRGLATYTIPKVDMQVSSVFQSKPGALLAANYDVPAATIAESLGRPPSGNVTFVTVNLVEPGTLYGDRINQLDFRVAKLLRFSGKRAMVALDIYNALNANPILTYNTAFVPNGPWLQPRSFAGAGAVLTGRLFRISAEFTF
jgi:Carboxypeptidase regulatory-like domain